MTSFVFTTAKDLVDIKIERNNTLIKLLEMESIILKKGILINYRWAEHNKEKVALIQQINAIEEKQREIYCSVRQSEVAALTAKVNQVSVDTESLILDIKKAQDKCKELLIKMNELNAQIPHQTIVTNYKMVNDQQDCHQNDV